MSLSRERVLDTLYALGHHLIERERPADAVHVFRTMMMAAPEDERSWLGLCCCHERTNELATAARLYAMAVTSVPRSFRCALAAARCCRQRDEQDLAEQYYDVAEERAYSASEYEIATAIAEERAA